MDPHEHYPANSAKPALPSPGRLLVFAVLLPAAVAGTNQLLFSSISTFHWLRYGIYPWMAFTTAVLSWSAGRYLQPAWLRWAVFAWCLVLLDLLTIAGCLANGPLPYHFAYVLVSSQISLVVIWALLSAVNWQWRLPGTLIALAVLIPFATLFDFYPEAQSWHAMMVLTSLVIVLSCLGLRLFGFVLQKSEAMSSNANARGSLHPHQFGLKHILVWATAMVPLLLVARGLDFLLLARLDTQVVFLAALAALTTAAVDLIAIWAVLGAGSWIARLVTFFLAPILMAMGLTKYFNYVYSQYRSFSSMLYALLRMRDDWFFWLWLDALLLAALLLFLRASGYRLMRKNT